MYAYINIKIIICLGCIVTLGCTNGLNQIRDSNAHVDVVFDKIKDIEIEKLKNIGAEWREPEVLLFRYHFPEDSIGIGIPFLLKRTDDKMIRYKSQNNWIAIDSIADYLQLDTIGLSVERMVYCFKLMENTNIKRINNINNPRVLYLEKDTLTFYYVFDKKYITNNKFADKLKCLEGNWWIEK